MRPSEALSAHRDAIRQLVLESGMMNPRIFGSVARGDDRDGSDLDMLVDLSFKTTPSDIGRVERRIAEATGLSVNLLVPKDLPPKFRDRVLSEAAPL